MLLFYANLEDFARRSPGPPVAGSRADNGARHRAFRWSLGLHAALLVILVIVTQKPEPAAPVKVEVVSIPIPPRPEAVERKPKKLPPKKVASERKSKPKAPPTEAVQGIPPSAATPEATGMATPLGNTLLTEDEGKRIKAEDVRDLPGDLSADARLILSSVITPKYTEAALESNLEGNFIVDVYVDDQGRVLQSELRKPVGFGMGERLLEAARQAQFVPRKNKFGRSEAGWAEIKFTLIIP